MESWTVWLSLAVAATLEPSRAFHLSLTLGTSWTGKNRCVHSHKLAWNRWLRSGQLYITKRCSLHFWNTCMRMKWKLWDWYRCMILVLKVLTDNLVFRAGECVCCLYWATYSSLSFWPDLWMPVESAKRSKNVIHIMEAIDETHHAMIDKENTSIASAHTRALC